MNDTYTEKNDEYVPKAHDNIDEALADFINKQWPDKSTLKQTFKRESYGQYICNGGKVQLRLDQGKQIVVRP